MVVYKASRMINFAVGDWMLLGSRLVATGIHGFGLGLGGALGFACVGAVAVALAFNRVVLRRLLSRSLLTDPLVGGGFSHVASYLVLIATLFVRPYGLFGRPEIERV